MDSKTAHISEGAAALEEPDAYDSLEGIAEFGNPDALGAGGNHAPIGSPGAGAAPWRAGAQDRRGARSRERLWSPLFVIVVAGTLCCFMVGQGLNSGTSVFIAHMGGSAAFAGVLAAVFSAAAAAARIVCGPLVDRAGRLRVMVGGAALLLAGTLVPAVSSNDAVFVVCRIVQGVGFSAATTASATAAADVLPLSRLGEGIGYYGLGQALAMSVGPALALFLVNTDPAANLYLGLAVIAALGLVLAALCRYERNPSRLPATAAYRRLHEEHRELERGSARGGHATDPCAARVADNRQARSSVPKPSARGLGRFFELSALPGALPMVVLSPAFGFGIFFVGLYGTSLGVANPGLFYTLSALSMIAVRLKSKSFMDRVAPIKICTASTACGLAGFLLLFVAGSSDLAYYAAGILYGVCLGVSMPLNQAVAVKNTPAERWGAANALYLLASDVGIGVSSIVWGLVNDAAGFPATICCVMGCILAAWVVAWFSYPSTRRKHKKA
ncbi:MFS transporter [Gordonibacter urolithinfaciens]|uniref:MFS transporter n=1 Tax=Gordonibacter urolithinfaciens TaxID=1335613 RepID=UPI003AABA43B